MITLKQAFDQVMTGEKDTSDAFTLLDDPSGKLDGRVVSIVDIDDHDSVIFFYDQWDNEFEVEFELIDNEIKLGRAYGMV